LKTLPAILNRPVRLGVLISGSGTTLLNFLDCIRDGTLSAEVPLVISSHPDCPGVQRASDAGLLCVALVRKHFATTAAFSAAVFDRFRQQNIDIVAMAGYLCLLRIPDDFSGRVLNIHPSLIPSFCGKGMYGQRVHEAVVERGVKTSGCTVHFADNDYDHGPIILQRSVELPDRTTAEEVGKLVFAEEKRAYPEAIRRVVSGRLSIDGRHTVFA
jgi:formyltetrahydrofolate-dependent phosphoribosylglycinamide formyltransferase